MILVGTLIDVKFLHLVLNMLHNDSGCLLFPQITVVVKRMVSYLVLSSHASTFFKVHSVKDNP